MRVMFALLVAVLFPAPGAHGVAAGAPVRLVALMPPEAKYPISRKVREGYELAVELANRRGGVMVGGARVPVELTLRDDPAETAAQSAESSKVLSALVQEVHPAAILSVYTVVPANFDGQGEVAEALQIPWVNAGNASKGFFSHGRKFSFGLLSPVSKIPDSVLRWTDEQQHAGKLKNHLRVAIVYTQKSGAHAEEFHTGSLEWLRRTPSRRASYEVVFESELENTPRSAARVAAELAAHPADVLLAYANLEGFLALQAELVKRRVCFEVATFGARGTEQEARTALGEAGIAYLLTAVWWSADMHQTPQGTEFLRAFRARYRREPEWYQGLSYESVRVTLAAIERAGSADPIRVRDQLASMRIDSLVPGGLLSFPADSGQQAQYPLVVLQNLPGGTSPVVYPRIAALATGVAPNPACGR